MRVHVILHTTEHRDGRCNFYIGRSGVIRKAAKVGHGRHLLGWNGRAVGVGIVGDPTWATRRALKRLTRRLTRKGYSIRAVRPCGDFTGTDCGEVGLT